MKEGATSSIHPLRLFLRLHVNASQYCCSQVFQEFVGGKVTYLQLVLPRQNLTIMSVIVVHMVRVRCRNVPTIPVVRTIHCKPTAATWSPTKWNSHFLLLPFFSIPQIRNRRRVIHHQHGKNAKRTRARQNLCSVATTEERLRVIVLGASNSCDPLRFSLCLQSP